MLRRASDAMSSGGSGILQTTSALASAPPLAGVGNAASIGVFGRTAVGAPASMVGLGQPPSSQAANKTQLGGIQRQGLGGVPRDQTPAAVRGGSPPLASKTLDSSRPGASAAAQSVTLTGPRIGTNLVAVVGGQQGATAQLRPARANYSAAQTAQPSVAAMPKAMPLKSAQSQVAKSSGNTTPLPPYGPTQASPRTLGPNLLLGTLDPAAFVGLSRPRPNEASVALSGVGLVKTFGCGRSSGRDT